MPSIKNQIIFIAGPTGVGKSQVGLALAQSMSAEIVSCDAMQVYREVNIACDKPSLAIRQQIPHHLIDVVSVCDEFDVAAYGRQANAAIENILGRGKSVIIVGGSGLYMNVLLDGIFNLDAKDSALRIRLEQLALNEGSGALHAQLVHLDPQAASKIHSNDTRRLIRALEVAMTTGQQISSLHQQRQGLWNNRAQQPVRVYALNRERPELYRRVEARIDEMFQQGLVQEIKALQQMPLSRTAATLIGIPEVTGHLNGQYDLERAKYLMKLNTRHYVKRQLTWLRRDIRVQWITMTEHQKPSHIIEQMK